MTHEPDCRYVDLTQEEIQNAGFGPDDCSQCRAARKAYQRGDAAGYQRGRDTASDAVDDFAYPMLQRGEITKEQYTGIIAAARRDGNHA